MDDKPRRFSWAQMQALASMDGAGDRHLDQSWIRPNTLRSLRGLCWTDRGRLRLTDAGRAAFRAAGGHQAADTTPEKYRPRG